MVKIMENPMNKWDDLGGKISHPYFWLETPLWYDNETLEAWCDRNFLGSDGEWKPSTEIGRVIKLKEFAHPRPY